MTTPANPGQSQTPAPAKPAAIDPTNTSVPVDDAPPEEVVVQEVAPKPKVISVPTHAMKKIKDEAAAAGRTAYQLELDAQAQELGYKDHADWVRASKEARSASSTTPSTSAKPDATAATSSAPAPKDGESPEVAALRQENQRLSRELENSLQDKKRSNRQFARAKREQEKLANQLLAKEAETELKLAAKDAGVEDVDYAVTVFQRMINGMSEEELKSVDEKKFFTEQLRVSHPHLYKAVDRPVNTGTKSGTEVTKPATAGNGAPPAPGNGASTDARTLTPQQFQDRLKSLGLSVPGAGGAIG